MDISYDPAKERRNVLLRGLSFELVHFFDWAGALIVEDVRRQYGERRYRASGTIGARLHVLVFTVRAGRVHVISLRKANLRELRRHEEQTGKSQTESGED
jgi:uncharacterized protein